MDWLERWYLTVSWLKRQMRANEARKLPARYRHVVEVLGKEGFGDLKNNYKIVLALRVRAVHKPNPTDTRLASTRYTRIYIYTPQSVCT